MLALLHLQTSDDLPLLRVYHSTELGAASRVKIYLFEVDFKLEMWLKNNSKFGRYWHPCLSTSESSSSFPPSAVLAAGGGGGGFSIGGAAVGAKSWS